MLRNFGNSTSEVSRQEFSFELGKMSHHGNIGYYLRAKDFCSWVRSRPSKGFCHKNSLATYNSKRDKKFPRTCWILQEIYKGLLKNLETIMQVVGKGCKF